MVVLLWLSKAWTCLWWIFFNTDFLALSGIWLIPLPQQLRQWMITESACLFEHVCASEFLPPLFTDNSWNSHHRTLEASKSNQLICPNRAIDGKQFSSGIVMYCLLCKYALLLFSRLNPTRPVAELGLAAMYSKNFSFRPIMFPTWVPSLCTVYERKFCVPLNNNKISTSTKC